MFDPLSFTVGFFIGGSLAAVAATIVNTIRIHQLRDENTRLSRELLKLGTRRTNQGTSRRSEVELFTKEK